MAAEIQEITESDQENLTVILGIVDAQSRAILECLRLLRKQDALLEQFRPLLDQYRTPLAAAMAARGARRRAVPQDANGQVPHP